MSIQGQYMIDRYIVIIPAYNEETTIKDALASIAFADKHTRASLEAVIVCLNGCTDRTKEMVDAWNGLPLVVIESPLGYLSAMNTLFRYARKHYPNIPMLKSDADSTLDAFAIDHLLSELEKHPSLILAGGHPLPHAPSGWSPYRKLKSRFLSIRPLYPLSEVAVNDVHAYHPFATIDPQPNIGRKEARLKIYFHGRLWCVRSALDIPLLDGSVLGDDVFLCDWLYVKHGPESLRVIYAANAYFRPHFSIIRHWKVYKRIYEDKQRVRTIPSLEDMHFVRKTKLDWSYINTEVPLYDRILFYFYGALRAVEEYSFSHTVYKASYWLYEDKEV